MSEWDSIGAYFPLLSYLYFPTPRIDNGHAATSGAPTARPLKPATRIHHLHDCAGGSGRVKVGDGEWNARGSDADIGTRVRIIGSRGSDLLVEPVALLDGSAAKDA